MRASIFLSEMRGKLSEDNEKIINHGLVREAEDGRLSIDKIRLFVTQQYYIVSYDLRSLAVMLSRSNDDKEAEFFHTLRWR